MPHIVSPEPKGGEFQNWGQADNDCIVKKGALRYPSSQRIFNKLTAVCALSAHEFDILHFC